MSQIFFIELVVNGLLMSIFVLILGFFLLVEHGHRIDQNKLKSLYCRSTSLYELHKGVHLRSEVIGYIEYSCFLVESFHAFNSIGKLLRCTSSQKTEDVAWRLILDWALQNISDVALNRT